jgi:hypothetical protein
MGVLAWQKNLGRYEIVRGSAKTSAKFYLAKGTELNRIVAIKTCLRM